jgi:hypothetical protein
MALSPIVNTASNNRKKYFQPIKDEILHTLRKRAMIIDLI